MLVVMYLLCQLIFTLNPFSKVCHILINFASYLPTPEPYLHVSMYRLSIFFITVLNVGIVLHAYN